MTPEETRKMKELKQWVTILQGCLEIKNKELDALHYVWCSGGCSGGTHRYSDEELTEDIVTTAERNTVRLRQWYDNRQYRKRNGTA